MSYRFVYPNNGAAAQNGGYGIDPSMMAGGYPNGNMYDNRRRE